MKKNDVLKIKPENLKKELDKLQKELFKLKSSSIAGEDANKKKGKIPAIKRDIARLKTLLNKQ